MTEPLSTLSSADGSLVSALSGPAMDQLRQVTLPGFLPEQRWFGAKDQAITEVRILPLAELEAGRHALVAADVVVGGETQRYLMPVSAVWAEPGQEPVPASAAPVLAHLRGGPRMGVLTDSALEPSLAQALLETMRHDLQLQAGAGIVSFIGSDALRDYGDLPAPRPLGAEQSNVSIAFGSSIILKLYRRLRAGAQPDVDVARFLTSVGQFRSTPAYLGEIQYRDGGEATTLAAAFAFVPNQGDAWTVATRALTQSLLDGGGEDAGWIGAVLGQRTAEMHKALAVDTTEPDFVVERLQQGDVADWAHAAVSEAESLLDRLAQRLETLPPSARAMAEQVLGQRDRMIARIKAALALPPSGGRSRIHGDYHLGQVLACDGDVMIIDFEGEPSRSLAERRAKSSPLRDVAGMLRSFHYAAWTALDRVRQQTGAVPDASRARAEHWRRRVTTDFIAAYQEHVAGAASYPDDPTVAKALTDLFVIQKAIYEVGYELANRPDWVEIPLSGILDLLDEGDSPEKMQL